MIVFQFLKPESCQSTPARGGLIH